MNKPDLRHLSLLLGVSVPSVFQDYVEKVANAGLQLYKPILQYGGKGGESLYTHVLNGVFVLEQVRPTLGLSDVEARVLFTAFTIHDLNKVLEDEGQAYRDVVTPEAVTAEITRLGLDDFFPAYADYVEDIRTLMHAHSAHYHTDGAGLFRDHNPYGLERARVRALIHLMRAADTVDLSHTLEERKHKDDFLFHLNSFSEVQYTFTTHRLTEDRGLLSNIIHESIVTHLRDVHKLIPLLFYPDGVAYLLAKGRDLALIERDLEQMGSGVAAALSAMTSANLDEFVESKPGGIKIMPKCLDLGLPFAEIWRVAFGKVQTRNLNAEAIADKARTRAESDFEKNAKAFPDVAEHVQTLLSKETPLTAPDEATLRLGEQARAYYIFIKEYFARQVDDPWHYVYRLIELPEARWPIYEYFHALWYRAYVLAGDISLSEEELARRFSEDGARLLAKQGQKDPKIALFSNYIKEHVLFDLDAPTGRDFATNLEHYTANQHRQCVTCSSTLPTSDWMAGDVRDDITVQAFSNRLRGGPGDPKKQVCPLCRIQFLVEKLNYPPVRGEKISYLHLFPYSFLTAPFIGALRKGIERLTRENLVERAFFARSTDAVPFLGTDQPIHLEFSAVTRSGKAQPFGLYLPRYSTTVGNHLIFPLNPAGSNDTERFLFTLWNAMLLQQYFGCKVLLSDSPVATLSKEDMPDLYIANAPLAARGLLRRNDYAVYQEDSARPGPLQSLWTQARHLFALYRLARSADTRRNELVTLVKSMGNAPLAVFYTAEKLLEARVSDREWPLIRLSQSAFPHVNILVHSIGGHTMTKLSTALRKLAEIAWSNGLRGRSLKKNSLMAPLDEVLGKLEHHSEAADEEALRAATVEDIFEHLERIADPVYRPGRKKWQAAEAFVNGFYDDVYAGVYGGKLQKLLADEKMIRSAYMFYIREQIPRKETEKEEAA